jgi:hypothetical protein
VKIPLLSNGVWSRIEAIQLNEGDELVSAHKQREEGSATGLKQAECSWDATDQQNLLLPLVAVGVGEKRRRRYCDP